MQPSRIVASGVAILSALVIACGASLHAKPVPVRQETPVTESNITRLTTSILEQSQFAHHPLNAELAGKFLDGYLDALDGAHAIFLESDVAELAQLRATLADATRTVGDTSARRTVWQRYLVRLEQRQSYVTELLKSDAFDFTGHDHYSYDREHAPRPSDLGAARALWREQLRAEYLEQKLGGAKPDQIASSLGHRYAAQLQAMKSLGKDQVLELYLDALAHVYDPHSDYLSHEAMENFSIAMNLSLFGIGATLESADGYCTVRELVPGGPAALNGQLKPGDRIVAVADAKQAPVDVTGLPLSRTVELIRGAKGTQVTLTVLPADVTPGSATETVALVRDKVQLEDQAAHAHIVDVPLPSGGARRLGVLELPSFYGDVGDGEGGPKRSATADVAKLIGKLKTANIGGLVLDLRGNGGGSLNEAVSLTGLFVPQGPIVQTRGPAGDVEIGTDDDPREQYAGPLIVLTNRLSASASEILTGALKDYGRAVVVGDSSTFGKGTVQSVLSLGPVMDKNNLVHTYDPGALKVTIRKFYRPDGASTQLRGVVSDIVLPSPSDLSDLSESSLKDPLPWDAIRPSRHDQLGLVAPYLAALRASSAQRVATDKAFGDVKDELERTKHQLAGKSLSLNEAERRAELAGERTRKEERARESQRRPRAILASYPITLRNAASSGLPPADPVSPQEPSDDDAPNAARPAPRKLHAGIADDLTLTETLRILSDYVEAVADESSAHVKAEEQHRQIAGAPQGPRQN